ncbi:hypothetical protein [Jannaschia sp. 2305UL9-9]|uniref:hypothetical protein n=1 Tax=Jannaschia sp. 2305UL9-9 TaxID=3121638 RepID=UPI003526D2E2
MTPIPPTALDGTHMTAKTTTHRAAADSADTTDTAIALAERELFWKPRHVRPCPLLEHVPFVFWLVATVRPHLTATVNLTTGVAHFAACQATERLIPEARCLGFHAGDAVPGDLLAYNAGTYADLSQLACAGPGQAAQQAGAGQVDLLLVEGTPTRDTLMAIRDHWLDRMSPAGVIVLPGGQPGDAMPGARPDGDGDGDPLADLRGTYPHVTFDHGGGCTVLLVGSQPAPALARLADDTGHTPGVASMHRMFARLGCDLGRSLRLDTAEARAETLQAEVATLSETVARLRRAQDDALALTARLQAEARDHAASEDRLKEAHEAHLEDLHAEVAFGHERIAELRRELEAGGGAGGDAEAEIVALRRQMAEGFALREARLAEMAEQADADRQAALDSRADLAGRFRELEHLTRLLEERDATIADLTGQLHSKDRAIDDIRAGMDRDDGQTAEHLVTLRMDLDARTQQLSQMMQERIAQTRRMATLEARIVDIRHTRDSHAHRIRQLLDSSSWKLSAPVRGIGRIVGKGRRP